MTTRVRFIEDKNVVYTAEMEHIPRIDETFVHLDLYYRIRGVIWAPSQDIVRIYVERLAV